MRHVQFLGEYISPFRLSALLVLTPQFFEFDSHISFIMASGSTNGWPSLSSTRSDNPFADSHGDPFDDRNATNLEDMHTTRASTETQRRNGYHQSTALSKQLRILEDIRNGK